MEKILEGSLAGFEVPDLLAFLGQGGRTGVLVLERPDTETKLFTASTSTDGCKLYLYLSSAATTKYAYGPAWLSVSVDTGVGDAATVSANFSANGSWGVNL